jgi:hypothetical protein
VVDQIGTQTPTGTPPVTPTQVTVYQYTMTDESGNPIDLVARLVNASDINIISAGDSGGDGGGSGGGDGGGGGGGGGAM